VNGGNPRLVPNEDLDEIIHAGMRGAVAAMAMTGMRVFTRDVGIVDQTPPEAIAKRRPARGLLRKVPRGRRRAVVEVAHWSYGVGGGMVFGLLPDSLRRYPWAGPAYGLVVWLGYELAIAPALGLSHAKRPQLVESAALAVDHLLYGFVLSEMRMRPQD
jgi:hypothetical protein